MIGAGVLVHRVGFGGLGPSHRIDARVDVRGTHAGVGNDGHILDQFRTDLLRGDALRPVLEGRDHHVTIFLTVDQVPIVHEDVLAHIVGLTDLLVTGISRNAGLTVVGVIAVGAQASVYIIPIGVLANAFVPFDLDIISGRRCCWILRGRGHHFDKDGLEIDQGDRVGLIPRLEKNLVFARPNVCTTGLPFEGPRYRIARIDPLRKSCRAFIEEKGFSGSLEADVLPIVRIGRTHFEFQIRTGHDASIIQFVEFWGLVIAAGHPDLHIANDRSYELAFPVFGDLDGNVEFALHLRGIPDQIAGLLIDAQVVVPAGLAGGAFIGKSIITDDLAIVAPRFDEFVV